MLTVKSSDVVLGIGAIAARLIPEPREQLDFRCHRSAANRKRGRGGGHEASA